MNHFVWLNWFALSSSEYENIKKITLIPPGKIKQIPCTEKELYFNTKILTANKIPV